MPKYIDQLQNEELARKKRNDTFAHVKAYIEQMHALEDLKELKADPKSKIEEKVNQTSFPIFQKPQNLDFFTKIKNAIIKPSKSIDSIGPKVLRVEKPVQPPKKATEKAPGLEFDSWDKVAERVKLLKAHLEVEKDEKPSTKEIVSTTPQILEAEKTNKPIAIPLPEVKPTDEEEELVLPAEKLEEEAPVEEAKPETAQRKNLWDMWQDAANELEMDLQDIMADPFESKAAQKVMLLCSHLASQMNHESAQVLLEFIEETRIENLKNAYKPGWKEWTPVGIQFLLTLGSAFCGFIPAAQGIVGSQAQGYKTAENLFNAGGGITNSVGQLNHTFNQGKQAVVGNELQSDNRLQQDLQHRRQQAEQAAKRELENIIRMAQQKHETVRSINS